MSHQIDYKEVGGKIHDIMLACYYSDDADTIKWITFHATNDGSVATWSVGKNRGGYDRRKSSNKTTLREAVDYYNAL